MEPEIHYRARKAIMLSHINYTEILITCYWLTKYQASESTNQISQITNQPTNSDSRIGRFNNADTKARHWIVTFHPHRLLLKITQLFWLKSRKWKQQNVVIYIQFYTAPE